MDDNITSGIDEETQVKEKSLGKKRIYVIIVFILIVVFIVAVINMVRNDSKDISKYNILQPTPTSEVKENFSLSPTDTFKASLEGAVAVEFDTSDWIEYEDSETGLSFKYPKDWVVNKNDENLLDQDRGVKIIESFDFKSSSNKNVNFDLYFVKSIADGDSLIRSEYEKINCDTSISNVFLNGINYSINKYIAIPTSITPNTNEVRNRSNYYLMEIPAYTMSHGDPEKSIAIVIGGRVAADEFLAAFVSNIKPINFGEITGVDGL